MHMYPHTHTKCLPQRWEGGHLGIRLRPFEPVTGFHMAHTMVFRASPGHRPVLTYRHGLTENTVGTLPKGDWSGTRHCVFIKGAERGVPSRSRTSVCVGVQGGSGADPPGEDGSHLDYPLRTKPRWKSGSSAAPRRRKPSETWSDMRATSSRNSGGPSTTNITFPVS